MNTVKISIAQINPIVGDLEHNFKLILKSIEQAHKEGAQVLITPELSLIGYPPKDLLHKHGLLEQQAYYIDELKAYTRGDKNSGLTIIVGGVSENKNFGKKLYNSLYCICNGDVVEVASKMLLPNYDVFDETRYFEPADHTTVIDVDGTKLGLSICEDIWIEAYPTLYLKDPVTDLIAQGAELIVNAAASPYAMGKAKRRRALLSSVARRYKVPVIYVNQVGANDELIFDGSSMAFDSAGSLVHQLEDFEPQDFAFDLSSLDASNDARTELAKAAELIAGSHIEPMTGATAGEEFGSGLREIELKRPQRIKKALELGVKDYVRKCGFSKVVLGLSGGIDSALVAVIATHALGAENVRAVMLPSKYTSQESLEDAQALAKNLGLKYESLSISSLHECMMSLMPDMTGHTEENIQPRLRANILMALSNNTGALLLCTGNKSEIAVGYCTLYGDTTGGVAVIGDLLKTQVYQLAQHINEEQEIIPQRIIDKAPSAELKFDQKDQDSLPPYEILDRIVQLYVQEMKTLDEIYSEFRVNDIQVEEELIADVLAMIDRNEYKRRQSPFVLKLAGKTFGLGRRMPIAQGFKQK